ncbi:MAG: glycosyl hydrolase family 28 protein [Desulfosporosinus sp.]|nr:glycosyl hydrolase family 28 protein [Desulfosporosinus sp.]
MPSGKTVYLAGGALVQGSFLINHAENVRIIGRGILYQLGQILALGRPNQPRPQAEKLTQDIDTIPSAAAPPSQIRSTRRDAILIEYSKNIEVEGIIEVPNTYTVLIGQSQNVTIRNIKSFSAGGNNDGIDIFSSSDVVVDGVFLRNSDDNIAIYGHRWNYYGDTRNVTVQNSTLWSDVAHPILVGTHGDTDHPDTLEDLKFANIDILDHREPQLDYQGCMSLNAGDSNLIRNVLFDNIRVEDFREGQLVNLRVFFNGKYNTSPGRGIENILFKDITYNGTHANPSIVAGYDDSRKINNILFENLKINGRTISDDMPGKPGYFKTADMANIFVGEHVDGIIFRATASTTRHNGQPR